MPYSPSFTPTSSGRSSPQRTPSKQPIPVRLARKLKKFKTHSDKVDLTQEEQNHVKLANDTLLEQPVIEDLNPDEVNYFLLEAIVADEERFKELYLSEVFTQAERQATPFIRCILSERVARYTNTSFFTFFEKYIQTLVTDDRIKLIQALGINFLANHILNLSDLKALLSHLRLLHQLRFLIDFNKFSNLDLVTDELGKEIFDKIIFFNASNNETCISSILLELIHLKNIPFTTLLSKNYCLIKEILEFKNLDSTKKAELLHGFATYSETIGLTLISAILENIKDDDNDYRLIKCKHFINSIDIKYLNKVIIEQYSFKKLLSFLPFDSQLSFALKCYSDNKDSPNEIVKQYFVSYVCSKKPRSIEELIKIINTINPTERIQFLNFLGLDNIEKIIVHTAPEKVCPHLAWLMTTLSDTEKELVLNGLGDAFLGEILTGEKEVSLISGTFTPAIRKEIQQRLTAAIKFSQFKQKVNEECHSYLQYLNGEFNSENPRKKGIIKSKILAVENLLTCINQNIENTPIDSVKKQFAESFRDGMKNLKRHRDSRLQRFINALKALIYTLYDNDYLITQAHQNGIAFWRAKGGNFCKSIETISNKFHVPLKVR